MRRAMEWFFQERADGLSPSWWFTILASLVALGLSLYSWGLSVGVSACLGGGR